MTTQITDSASAAAVIESVDVVTGEPFAAFPAMTHDEVATLVKHARAAAQQWRTMGFEQRKARLLAWAAEIVSCSHQFTFLMHRENGKPVDDAYLELVIAVEHIRWAAYHAKRVLRPRRVPAGVLMANYRASIDYEPFGVIGVISPWNYPIFAPVAQLASALAAGNTAVLKPSELATAAASELVAAFARANPDLPQGILTLATGAGEAGAGLITGGVDKVAFTGSPTTARKILRACADTLTPAVMECGGKDAMIVAADADIDQAADAAAWGAFSNAGQTCVGVERIYVHQDVAQRFVAALQRRLKDVSGGHRPGSTYGPMTMASQVEVVRAHVQDALQGGATAPLGGTERIRGRICDPIVLLDADESSRAVQEETFGPTVTVTTVADLAEAIRLANGTRFGLGAAVFSRRDGERIAQTLRCGMVSINSVLAFVSIPGLPFGGVGESGFGRIHAAEGLREFSRPKSLAQKRFDLPGANAMLFTRPAITIAMLKAVTNARFTRHRNRRPR
ncbi:aldehyde dehydrogenase family protein [Mycobacterium arosiense]|uniref:Aldehyde dehydrogenase n=1 Tax=Mycobacterium arosiense ATCC BAA-1401 = DSM 45069 TaxID=1265311 RepID=A0A1W9ZC50_MYCAI|nr:aldehyde dehydrogenase family protein [Mycobacterium arosiense]ORA11419.1 aldehyde dehydrogenase [Mycobacterium arosiense ATCC BAA-1401 = DSM 45069]